MNRPEIARRLGLPLAPSGRDLLASMGLSSSDGRDAPARRSHAVTAEVRGSGDGGARQMAEPPPPGMEQLLRAAAMKGG